jgi:putative endonuclease
MAKHNETGKEGEALALGWLRQNGFEILHCNWRFKKYEIDIIARKNNRLHFIEVKARHYVPGAYPEEQVTKKKFRFIKTASEEFLYLHPEYHHAQIDVLAITFHKNNTADFFLIEDVFF